MQQYHGTERPAEAERPAETGRPAVRGSRLGRLIRRTFALAFFAALAGAVVYVSMLPEVQRQFTGRRAARMQAGPVPVTVAQARIDNVPLYLEGVGTAKARSTVTVRPQVDGRILSIHFKEGQDVKRGDVLAKIDPATYQAQLDQTVAKKTLDEADLENAIVDLDRYNKLGAGLVIQKTIDTQRALVEKLKAQLKVDDAAIANAKAYLEYTTIVAPIDGRTGIRMVDEGNLVRGSDLSQGIVVITELRPVSVLFTLPQQQLLQVNKAQAKGALTVEALGADGRQIDRGTLQVVDNQVDPATGTIRMKAEFPNAELQLWPGQFVNVRLLIDTLEGVVVIPTPAVQRGPNNSTFVYVLGPEDIARKRTITVAHLTETLAVVSSGIGAKEKVVTTGFTRLKDGATVTLPATDEQPPATSAAPPPPPAKAGPRGELRNACAGDIAKLCPNVERSRAAIRACLQANAAQLSEACKAAAAGAEERPRKTGLRKAEGNDKE
jgi:membrane fusion protein, multidrug efflux system